MFIVGGNAIRAAPKNSRSKSVDGVPSMQAKARQGAPLQLVQRTKRNANQGKTATAAASSSSSSSSTRSQRPASSASPTREYDLPLPPPPYYEHQSSEVPCSCQGGVEVRCMDCKSRKRVTYNSIPCLTASFSQLNKPVPRRKPYRMRSVSPELETVLEECDY